jgi:thiamine-phosphate pyrophosphorylase
VGTRAHRLQNAHLYLVCDEQPDGFLEAALSGGVDVVQLRMKNRSDEAILTAAAHFAPLCQQHGALFILNDRPDLVTAARADGVHLGQDDTSVTEARSMIGSGRIIGLSTHSRQQIDAAAQLDVDYIGVGPVYDTPTKPGRPGVGVDLVRYAAEHAQMPFFAIGGINAGNVGAVAHAGAARVAVVRALTDSTAPEPTAAALRRALERGEASVGAT